MEDFLNGIEGFRIKPRRRLLKGGKGHHRGSGFGSSLDFYGHRQYMAGDDIRKIDWKAYLRTESFYIKEFTESRQLNVNIILDNSKSMDFGNPKKWELAKTVSLGIGYLTLKQMDTLSLFTLNEDISGVLHNARGRDSFYKMIKNLSQAEPYGKTDFGQIRSLGNFKPGITFIVSDFFCSPIDELIDYLYLKGQEVILIHILDSLEYHPNYEKELKLVDMETGDIRRVKFDRKVKELYAKKIHDFIEGCKLTCETREAAYIFALTDVQPREILARALGGA